MNTEQKQKLNAQLQSLRLACSIIVKAVIMTFRDLREMWYAGPADVIETIERRRAKRKR